MTAVEEVMAVERWRTNARLIAHGAVPLGYLRKEWRTLDPTYRLGKFWSLWRPLDLLGTDLDPAFSMTGESVDFTALPYEDESFDATTLDGPYKLNGTPSEPDVRYGVDVVKSWQERHALINGGIVECARVTRFVLLVKCQDQVCGDKVRWQTREFADTAAACGFGLVDRLDMIGSGRKQPERTKKCTRCKGEKRTKQDAFLRQECTACEGVGHVPSTQHHAHQRPSTLLVLQRGFDPTR